jgi:aspartyl-tRNA(Asn)/glutamyl-tRNA(Gln) amidotransferase subunit C
MSVITPEETARLAMLARLDLTAEEQERFPEQLARIVGYIELLQEVDLDGDTVPGGAPAELPLLRGDLPGPMLAVGDALAGVPVVRDDQVVVPKFKED